MTEVIYVVAGDRREFDHWRFDNQKSKGVYVQSADILRGAKGVLLYIGSYRDRTDWQKLDTVIDKLVAVGDLKESDDG